MSGDGEFRHVVELRVRWAEVDMQGVVFNAHYLTYCDVCITEYWRAIGLRYPEEVVALGVDFFTRKATVEYHAPAIYDDELSVCGRAVQIGRSSLRFVVAIFRKGTEAAPLIDAELVYVAADIRTKRPQPWPALVRQKIVDFERVPPLETGHAA